ncbi:tetratricopeptide repeat protein [Micromonospora sp. HUAS LYJ1]|uniref:tetratricopeptide repeat protein n=1 Tax=Micromonospora sp. HUAS LYJ1 TaxID=3061626 RepID=UPI00267338C5|nr:tetratricopeptide repeat protein [Micromonospora sp. HUAS LYJ1]WKU04961.1 tetratricopeptide repeat protein [Micromonospora sp. HUAS LYJ1]
MTSWDVFLCYKSEDFEAASSLREALEAAGRSVFLDVLTGEDFAPLTPSVEAALLASRTLVALITPRFPMSPHCRAELHTALTAAYDLDDGDTSRVMAVTRGVSAEEVRPRQLTTMRLPAAARPLADLAAAIGRHVDATDRPFGAAPPRLNPQWLPAEVPSGVRFRGRAADVWELHEKLRAREKNATLEHPVVAVRGPGGIGKTALCLQYARWFYRDHPGGVFVLRLDGSRAGRASEALLRQSYAEQLAAIASRLGAAGPDDLAAALDRLAKPYLWIIDDVPATTGRGFLAELCAPTRLGRTLLTSRGRVAHAELALAPLGVDDGEALLTSYRGPTDNVDRRAARAVVRLLDGHALGLTLAAGLTTLPGFSNYQGLLIELTEVEPDHLESAASQLREELPPGCAQPFANTLLRSFDAFDPATRELLCAASVLAPAVIPVDLLVGMVRRTRSSVPGPVHDGLGQAVQRGLLDHDGTDGYLMHAMVARTIRIWVHPASRRTRLRDAALAELTDAVEQTRDGYRHGVVLPFLPHVRAVAGLLPGGDRWNVDAVGRYLVNEAGRVQIEAGESSAGLATFRALHQVCLFPSVDAITEQVVRIGLAIAYEAEGDYSTALRLKTEAHQGLVRALGPTAVDTVTAHNNVAVGYLLSGEVDRAHRILTEVYRARRAHPELGPLHRDTLFALGNLAIVRDRLGRTPAERTRHHRVAHHLWTAADARWRKVARPDEPGALDARNGLALNLRALGRLEDALRVATGLREQRAALLGPDHPDTLDAWENELVIRSELDRPGAASFADLLVRRLATRPGHPSTRITMANLLRGEPELRVVRSTVHPPALSPTGMTPYQVRLDGDHVDAELALQQAAMACQQYRVDALGCDDPRTMVATAYLAYAMALADHLDGQVETAAVLAEDASEGLAEAADTADPRDVEAARLIHEWIGGLLAGSA